VFDSVQKHVVLFDLKFILSKLLKQIKLCLWLLNALVLSLFISWY